MLQTKNTNTKLKTVKSGWMVGEVIPSHINDSTRGKYVESIFVKNGFDVNTGKGADFPTAETDSKSRKLGSKSPYTVSMVTEDHLINTNYVNSNVYPKMQKWNMPIYSETHREIVRHEEYDFSSQHIQDIFKEGYESVRSKIAQGVDSNYVRSDNGYITAEKQRKNGWQIRIPHAKMKKIKAMSKQAGNNLFVF